MGRSSKVFGAVFVLSFAVTLAQASEAQRGGSAGSLFADGPNFLQDANRDGAGGGRVQMASLFVGREGASLFAVAPRTVRPVGTTPLRRGLPPGGASIERVLQLIGNAEAGPKGYDAVQYSAKILPPRRPTTLSIAEIYRWIDETPGQQHAMGRYQFIPKTLKRLVRDLGVDKGALFSPALQDRLAARLVEEAGLTEMEAGTLGRHQFMNNLAKIWAGLPTSSGKSHYHGYAGNRATMSWARFDAEMARIFPG